MEMDDVGWISSEDSENSENERDLEIALYSQIHFDPVPEENVENNNFMNIQNLQFPVGVEEIGLPLNIHHKNNSRLNDSLKATASKLDNAIIIPSSESDEDEDDADFLSSEAQKIKRILAIRDSISKQNNDESDVRLDNLPLRNIAFEENLTESEPDQCDQSLSLDASDNDDMLILNAYSKMEKSWSQNNTPSESPPLPSNQIQNQALTSEKERTSIYNDRNIHPKILLDPPQCSLKTRDEAASVISQLSDRCHKAIEKPADTVPFKITKDTVYVTKESSSQDPDSEEEPVSAASSKSGNLKHKHSNLMEQKDYLQFSNASSLSAREKKVLRKKKRLSKQEAAVQPRKPSVVLRRPPLVKVSYPQDSDTNTEYSDSDVSHKSSPEKAVVNRSLTKVRDKVLKKISDMVERYDTSSSLSTSSSKKDTPPLNLKRDSKLDLDLDSRSKKKRHSIERDTQNLNDNEGENKELILKVSDSDTDSSLSSNIVDLDKDTVPNPDLDFNIEGGVDALLKRQAGTSKDDVGEKWQITDKDRYQILLTSSRYFSPLSITCRNCNEEGHRAANCPQPKKSVCIYCGKVGHVFHRCPDSPCFNCSAPGHKSSDCRERRGRRYANCNRCWISGHTEENCPDLWRSYHLTRESDHGTIQTASKKNQNTKVYCYNCGEKGHLGYECTKSTMNAYVTPNYPFIAKYDTGGKRKEKNITKRSQDYKNKKKISGSRSKDKDYKSQSTKEEDTFDVDKNGIKTKAVKIEKSHKLKKDKTKRSDGEIKKDKTKKDNREIKKDKTKKDNREVKKDKTMIKDREIKKDKTIIKDQEVNKDTTIKKDREIKKDKSKRDDRKEARVHEESCHINESIVTGTTVYSFQNPTSSDDRERNESPPRKKVCTVRRDESLYQRSHKTHERDLRGKISKSKRSHHNEQTDDYDEMMQHQVFDNEWWNEEGGVGSGTRKKGSRRDKTSQSSTYYNDEHENQEMQSDYATHPRISKRKRRADAQERRCDREIRKQNFRQFMIDAYPERQNAQQFTFQTNPRYEGSERKRKNVKPWNRGKKKNRAGFTMDSQFLSIAQSCKK